jgi:eukaryotic-like serine/threonine-protein kinase
MTPEKYHVASDLFLQIRDLPKKDREIALDAAVRGDKELRDQVCQLLEADEAANISFLNRPAIQDAAALLDTTDLDLLHSGDIVAQRYRVSERIGAGGMGVVYKAEDLRLERPLAIKVLPAIAKAGTGEKILRFQREARAASQLNHPNIVAIQDSGTEAGLLFIAMEYVEGQTLRALISEGKLPDAKTVLDVVSQVASALSAVHYAGIIHRDIKPENIMIRPDGFVKVLDFGLARMRDQESGHSKPTFATRTGQVAGTLQYLSPEQVLGKVITPQTDLFGLGVVAYEFATGMRPFDGPTDGAAFDAILRRDPPPPSAARPEVGTVLDALIMGAIEKDTDLRFQSAAELRSACKRAERSLTARPKDRNSPRRVTLAWRLPPSALGIVAAGIAAAAFLLYQNRSLPIPKLIRNSQITTGASIKSFVNDGVRLYYATGHEGADASLLEVSTSGGTAREIPSLRGMTPLDISPDHSEILLGKADTLGTQAVWVASVLGNGLRRVGDLTATYVHWSSRGDRIVYSTGADVSVANADGSDARTLFKLRADGHITDPFFLDKDKKIRFETDEQNLSMIWEMNADGSGVRRVLPGWREATLQARPVVSADGRYSLFIAGQDAVDWDLWGVRESAGLFRWRGPKPFRLTAGPLSVDRPQFSPSGRRIFYVGDLLQCELVQFDPAMRNWKPFLRGINAFQLEFSRDGKWITYVAPPGRSAWHAREDGSEAIQLTAPPLNAINPRLSPDNSEVVFWGSVPGQTPGMFMVSAKGGPVQLLTQDRKPSADEREPSWSTDGHSVLYEVRGALWILNVSSRKAVRLPGSEGLQFPRWSPDGKYGVAADAQSRLWLYDLAAQKRVLLTAAGSGYPTWSLDSQFVYFQNDASSIWYRVRITDRNITEVVRLAGLNLYDHALGWVGITPTGKTISARETTTRQIYAMDWDAPE